MRELSFDGYNFSERSNRERGLTNQFHAGKRMVIRSTEQNLKKRCATH